MRVKQTEYTYFVLIHHAVCKLLLVFKRSLLIMANGRKQAANAKKGKRKVVKNVTKHLSERERIYVLSEYDKHYDASTGRLRYGAMGAILKLFPGRLHRNTVYRLVKIRTDQRAEGNLEIDLSSKKHGGENKILTEHVKSCLDDARAPHSHVRERFRNGQEVIDLHVNMGDYHACRELIDKYYEDHEDDENEVRRGTYFTY